MQETVVRQVPRAENIGEQRSHSPTAGSGEGTGKGMRQQAMVMTGNVGQRQAPVTTDSVGQQRAVVTGDKWLADGRCQLACEGGLNSSGNL